MAKGDRRRKTLIPQAEADANFEAIFGKYVPLYLRKQIPDTEVKQENDSEVEKSNTQKGQ